METEKPLVNQRYLLEKYPGKGGWTCLKEDPMAYKTFLTYSDGQKKEFIDWIYSAKMDETKVERMAEALNKFAKHQKPRGK